MTANADALTVEPSLPATRQWLSWLLVVALIYLLLAGVGAIGDGFKAATGNNARELFAFATNPLVGLMIGLVATALIQSSSTVTSIIVGMVAGGLPIPIAIPLIMGANIGTSLTSTIVSLGHIRSGEEFRRAFSAATVHDAFNITAVAILLPLELLFQPLQRLSESLAGLLVSDASVDMKSVNFMKTLLSPASDLLAGSVSWLPGAVWSGVALILIGVAMILFVVTAIGKVLRKVMVGRAKDIMHASVGRGPLSGIASGSVITVLVQSSSTTTALIVPLAGSGVFSLKQVYPFTLGTNIGTCVTALLAATAITGPTAELAMQIALVHLLFNLLGILIIYALPFLRGVPPMIAEGLATLAQRSKLYVAAYIAGVFFALPLLLIGASQI
ncbi:solute carrier family 34 (sodium-dependent phosphate cotransporter) [Pseudomonas sp. NFACC19-2]|uniref:Solute carrier family 34 (Sodium-dependent phosphate cotransporter) n=1 Tax=Ectopseudomonas toyotomiensis TaxID=554344 RepID=A0A1I5WQT5_9GAMM|nr:MULTISPECIES: Na/Pi symporter [Pseudomonas]PIA70234.1 sodium:phosphate symporter [Pseudomonas toyotomiensis]SDA73197.1 solute carrier family 34 (sodium-dependent phosphate cotransporter) [Pseudomonas sp. NFPP33]SFQ22165.1 solute carrier family 34 (sodium-dependent phosphate cotransporter) [Pseudomonas toyotomiensis]SFW47701.1 solute carrier family 34 (sodium-dependent phosphate cotransporter) [Pseudomonas sp. NFACC19-2]